LRMATASGRDALPFDGGHEDLWRGTIQEFPSDKVLLSARTGNRAGGAWQHSRGVGGVQADLENKSSTSLAREAGRDQHLARQYDRSDLPWISVCPPRVPCWAQVFRLPRRRTNPVTGGPATWTNSGGPRCAAPGRLSPDWHPHRVPWFPSGRPVYTQTRADQQFQRRVYNRRCRGLPVNLSGVATGWPGRMARLPPQQLHVRSVQEPGVRCSPGVTIYGPPPGLSSGTSPLPYLQDFPGP